MIGVGLRRVARGVPLAGLIGLFASVATNADALPDFPTAPQPASPPAAVARVSVVRPIARRHKVESGPPPANARLHVTPGALGTPWTFEITNYDDTPLRLVTDARLLSLDVSPGDDANGKPQRRPVVRCSLPSELRPTTDEGHVRTLPPAVTYVAEFDPRFYCFDGRGAAALTPDAKLVAHLGWPGAHTAAPPFIVDQTLTGHARSGVKDMVADEVTVPDTISSDAEPPERHALVVHAPSHIDAESGRDLAISVTVENTTTRPVHLMLRPETLAFEISSTKGVYDCSGRTHPASPIAEVFTTIAPHAKASTSVLLAAICPEATFKTAGLYTVLARLDTSRASGRAIGIETFDGVARATEPTLVRVRRDRARRP